MHHNVAGLSNINRQDVAGNAGGKGQLAGRSHGAVLGYEEAAASSDALDGSKDAAAAADLDGSAHPGQLARLGDDGVVGVERKLKDRHCGSGDAMLHGEAPVGGF